MAATLGPLDEFLTARIIALIDPYERAGLRGSSRAMRRACGDAPRKMTPRKMWKYAAIRGLDVMMSRACDAGARDLMRYAGTRASFDECRTAWSARFSIWRCMACEPIGDEMELAEIRAVVCHDRTETRLVLESDADRATQRICLAVGKYADEDIIRSAIIGAEHSARDLGDGLAIIIAGTIIAHRNGLARDLIEYIRKNWDCEEDFNYLSGRALRSGNIEIFKLINGDDRMEGSLVDDAARSGNLATFKCARKQYIDWRDDIDNVLECAVESGSIEMLEEVRECNEMKCLKYRQRSGAYNVSDLYIDFNFNYSTDTMEGLAVAAARKGKREMCDYILAWSRASGDFDEVCESMMKEAIARDYYWVVDLVSAHMRAVQGPGYARPRAAIRAPCCAIMLRE